MHFAHIVQIVKTKAEAEKLEIENIRKRDQMKCIGETTTGRKHASTQNCNERQKKKQRNTSAK